MADKKLTALPELTNPADGDFLYIVDISDLSETPQGSSKKIKKLNFNDVIEVASLVNLPLTGSSSKIYVTIDTKKIYRWNGGGYDELGMASPWTVSGNDIQNSNTGLVAIGNSFSAFTDKLKVNGDITANGILRSNGLSVSSDRVTGMYVGSGGYGLWFRTFLDATGGDISLGGAYNFSPEYPTNNNPVSGIKNIINSVYTIAPTSGNTATRMINLVPTINQTGGANGIIHGIRIAPILISAADFRAIEVTDGKSIFKDVTVLGTLGLRNVADTFTSLFTNANTAGRTYTLPNRDITFAGLDDISNVQRNIIKNTTTSTPVTGTVSQTILYSDIIRADSFKNGDFFNIILSRVGKTGTAGTLTQTVRINTTNTLTGATTIALNTGTTANLNHNIGRRYSIEGGSLKGLGTGSAQSDMINSSAAITSYTFDPTIDNYIFVVGQLSNIADSMFHSSFILTN